MGPMLHYEKQQQKKQHKGKQHKKCLEKLNVKNYDNIKTQNSLECCNCANNIIIQETHQQKEEKCEKKYCKMKNSTILSSSKSTICNSIKIETPNSIKTKILANTTNVNSSTILNENYDSKINSDDNNSLFLNKSSTKLITNNPFSSLTMMNAQQSSIPTSLKSRLFSDSTEEDEENEEEEQQQQQERLESLKRPLSSKNMPTKLSLSPSSSSSTTTTSLSSSISTSSLSSSSISSLSHASSSSSSSSSSSTTTAAATSTTDKKNTISNSTIDSSHVTDIINRRRQMKRRRRGRLRKLYDMFNAITSLLLLLIPPSLLMMVHKFNVSLSKFYRYMIIFMSNRLVSQILWIIGISIAVTILPINLVNATSSDSNERQDDLESSYLNNTTINMTGTGSLHNETEKKPLFPPDLFTREQLENGAVIFYILGVIYMFVALAIVCDEFFVPSLDVIIEKLDITDDVAGATFMAAGGSAPELFTSVIGVFVSFDDVGIGTIVGSAVFNILFVIGMCALFSKTVLSLTWWPLFRDCSFYSVSLLILIYFFRDNLIYWWEALVLFFIYIGYVGFMKWNQQVERCVKKVVYKNKVTRVRSTDQLMPAGNAANSSETSMATQPGGSVTSRAASETRSGPPGSSSGATGNSSNNAGSTVTGAKFRHGLLQLMIHTIDPLHDDDVPGKVDEKATQLHAIASLKVLLDATKPQRGAATTSAANHVKINLKETTLASDRPNGNIDTTIDSPTVGGRRPSWIEQRVKLQTRRFSTKGNDLAEEPEALSMSWPDTGRKRITYLLVAPIVFPLWLTLPDTRTPRGKRFFPVTFIGSILWIAAYSYLMVWWANVAGDTARIPPEVMGLTFLAAGTSIPDLITSVIVARKGFGDMAVSSSVGSNIFDVTVGLPIPWLLYGIIYQQPVEVNSVGMVCSITILFMMLLFVVMSIACFRWRMNKGLGLTMFVLYFVFVAVSLMFEYKIITCPV